MEGRREEGRVYMTVWTSYQGVEVVESDSTVKYRHPRLSKDDQTRLAVLDGASLLWLVDGTLLVVCDAEGCGFNGITGREPYVKPEGEQRPIVEQAGSLFSHINGTHRSSRASRADAPPPPPPPAPTFSRYSEAQIKVFIKVWLKWKATGIKEWTQAACDELERLGFVPRFAEKWTPDQLGSLARSYLKRDQFKNIKAGPMDESDRAALEEMVSSAAARASSTGRGNLVATTARITTSKPRRAPWHQNLVDADPATMTQDDDAAEEQQEEDVSVTAADPANPTLSFARPGAGADPTPTRTIVVEPDSPTAAAPGARALTEAHRPVEESDYEHLTELEGGTPLFRYKGSLMAGRPVKGIEF